MPAGPKRNEGLKQGTYDTAFLGGGEGKGQCPSLQSFAAVTGNHCLHLQVECKKHQAPANIAACMQYLTPLPPPPLQVCISDTHHNPFLIICDLFVAPFLQCTCPLNNFVKLVTDST